MAGCPIICRHYVRFRNAKAVTWVDSRHGFFASDDDIVRIIGWPARWRQSGLFFSDVEQKPPGLFRRFVVFREGEFYEGALFLQEETGTLRDFFSVCRAVDFRISADF